MSKVLGNYPLRQTTGFVIRLNGGVYRGKIFCPLYGVRNKGQIIIDCEKDKVMWALGLQGSQKYH